MINSKMCEYNHYLAVCHIMPVFFTGPGPPWVFLTEDSLFAEQEKRGRSPENFTRVRSVLNFKIASSPSFYLESNGLKWYSKMILAANGALTGVKPVPTPMFPSKCSPMAKFQLWKTNCCCMAL